MGGSIEDMQHGFFGKLIDWIVWLMIALCGGPKKEDSKKEE